MNLFSNHHTHTQNWFCFHQCLWVLQIKGYLNLGASSASKFLLWNLENYIEFYSRNCCIFAIVQNMPFIFIWWCIFLNKKLTFDFFSTSASWDLSPWSGVSVCVFCVLLFFFERVSKENCIPPKNSYQPNSNPGPICYKSVAPLVVFNIR